MGFRAIFHHFVIQYPEQYIEATKGPVGRPYLTQIALELKLVETIFYIRIVYCIISGRSLICVQYHRYKNWMFLSLFSLLYHNNILRSILL